MSVSALLGVLVTNWLLTMSFWEWGTACRSSSPREQVFLSRSMRLILMVGVTDQKRVVLLGFFLFLFLFLFLSIGVPPREVRCCLVAGEASRLFK